MKLHAHHSAQLPAAMNKFIIGLTLLCLVVMTPFALNNLIKGRFVLATLAFLIVAIFLYVSWKIFKYKKYNSKLILFGLVPSILFFLTMSMVNQGMIGVLWCFPGIISFYFMLPQREAWFANAALLAIAIPFAWLNFDPALASRIIATLVLVSILTIIFIHVITEQSEELRNRAATDALTGLLNRVTLTETLTQAIQQNSRAQVPMTLIAMDIDHFKQINDTYGHDGGDSVLVSVAGLLQERCRQVDSVFRMGGEEFLLLLYNTERPVGTKVAETLRLAISDLDTIASGPVTVSIGVATLEPGETYQGWMKRSDANLYQAKADGRNRVVA